MVGLINKRDTRGNVGDMKELHKGTENRARYIRTEQGDHMSLIFFPIFFFRIRKVIYKLRN
jgi:hypothetical protein